MAKTITLTYTAYCRECGAELKPGDVARYYGRGRVYGAQCHQRSTGKQSQPYRGEDYPCSDLGYEDQCYEATRY